MYLYIVGVLSVTDKSRSVADQFVWYLTGVCGPCLDEDRTYFLNELNCIGLYVEGPWFVVGVTLSIMALIEGRCKNGQIFMVGFNHWILEHNLSDHPFGRCLFHTV